jgi:hypothetical protein
MLLPTLHKPCETANSKKIRNTKLPLYNTLLSLVPSQLVVALNLIIEEVLNFLARLHLVESPVQRPELTLQLGQTSPLHLQLNLIVGQHTIPL